MEPFNAGLEILEIFTAELGSAGVPEQRTQAFYGGVGFEVDAEETIASFREVEQVEPNVQRIPRTGGEVGERHISPDTLRAAKKGSKRRVKDSTTASPHTDFDLLLTLIRLKFKTFLHPNKKTHESPFTPLIAEAKSNLSQKTTQPNIRKINGPRVTIIREPTNMYNFTVKFPPSAHLPKF